MINPKTVSYVRAVAEEGSFSKAAEKLYISQPSLSANILRAEKDYDVQFFNRNTNPVTLTYAGEIFLKEAAHIEQMDEQLTRKLLDVNNNVTGRIIVGESPTISSRFIPRLFQNFHQKYPQVQLSLKEGTSRELMEDVRHGRADLAFISCQDSVPELTFVPVIQREIFMAHASEKTRPVQEISLENLEGEPFILLQEGRELRKQVETLFHKKHFHPVITFETGSYELSLRLAEAGLGWAFIVDVEKQNSNMQYYRLHGNKELYQVSLVYRKDSYLSKPMQYFMDLSANIDKEH